MSLLIVILGIVIGTAIFISWNSGVIRFGSMQGIFSNAISDWMFCCFLAFVIIEVIWEIISHLFSFLIGAVLFVGKIALVIGLVIIAIYGIKKLIEFIKK